MLASLTIFTVLATKARYAGCGHSKKRVRQGMCKGASLRLSAAEHPESGQRLGESGSRASQVPRAHSRPKDGLNQDKGAQVGTTEPDPIRPGPDRKQRKAGLAG